MAPKAKERYEGLTPDRAQKLAQQFNLSYPPLPLWDSLPPKLRGTIFTFMTQGIGNPNKHGSGEDLSKHTNMGRHNPRRARGRW